jgi:acyl transferase domain-containing protein
MMRDEFHLQGDHPILANHRVHGQGVFPGVAYIDLLFQFFREAGHPFRQLELRNLSIFRPLIVPAESSVLVRLTAEEKRDGMWQVRVEAGDGTQPIVRAEVHRSSHASPAERLDLGMLEGKPAIDLDVLYAVCCQQELVHGAYLKGAGRVFDLGEHVLVEVRLGAAAAGSVDEYLFHPTLLDACAIGSMLAFGSPQQEPERLFLPLSYGAFRASQPIQERCWARVARGAVLRGAEVVTLSLEFFDAEGAKVGELVDASIKAVRTPQLGNDRRAVAPGPVRRSATRPANAFGAERFLCGIFAEELGRPAGEIEATLGYYDAGLDSAGLLSLVQRIETELETSLSPTLLFEFPTIAELARHFEDAYPERFQAGMARTPVAVAAPPRRALNHATALGEIAVVGLAGRYPGAESIAAFWENLKAGRDSVTEVPGSRWNWHDFTSWKTASGKAISRWGGFLDHVDCFDPGFFRISPAEAELIDPQERHFLEMAWSAVEDAGYTPAGLAHPDADGRRRKVGVFAGVMHRDYMLLGAEAAARGQRVPVSLTSAQIANRVSYHLNFHGPSMVVDTVCSSSLTAVHLALESLRHGECEVALAGGVNLTLHPEKYLTYGMLDLHASDGRCRSFGAGGDGYVSSEGVGVVVLKPLERAVADRDHIYATIKASVVNHGGQVSGLTVPSPVAQAEMIAECLEKAGVPAATVSYVEAHGTGTALGDPIEISGLTKAFGAAERPYCAIGSVKSNIGHAESAAGISGLSKVILQLHHRTLVASLHAAQGNPLINFAGTPFFLQQTTEPWPEQACPRRAGLSSFGATGSNANLLLEEYTADEAPVAADPGAGVQLVPLSARSAERLQAVASNLLRHLPALPALDLPAVACTLQTGRLALAHRVIFAVESLSELSQVLERYVAGERSFPHCWQGQAKRGDRLLALLGGEAEGTAMVTRWLGQGEWAKVAEVWVAGWDLDWRPLYAEGRPRRVALPTYPFEREPYWLPRGAAPARALPAPATSEPHGVLMMEPVWMPMAAGSGEPGPGAYEVFVCDLEGNGFGEGAGHVCAPDSGSLDEKFARCAEDLLLRIQQIFHETPSGQAMLQVLVPWDGEADMTGSEALLGLSGITRAAQMENPRFVGQVILLSRGTPPQRLQEILRENRDRVSEREIRYEQERRTVLSWRESPAVEANPDACWRRDGTYLITGGMGGLGLIFAGEIARRARGARLILTGRSPLSPASNDALQRLRALGAEAEYHVLDVAQPGLVAALVRQLEERGCQVRGIIHSAGVLRDRFIRQKTAGELQLVFAPKVRGLMLLDDATKHLPLDFMVLFSSGAGATGNLGQADYAAANGFMDAVAGYRQKRVSRGERQGRTLSLGWPLWAEGGMRVGAEIQAAMKARAGLVPMSTANGLAAFYRAMAAGAHRVLIAEGDVNLLRRFWREGGLPSREKSAPAGSEPSSLEAVLERLKLAFSAVTKHPVAELQDDEPFETYGIDSIVITQLNGELAEPFSQLPKTIFYEQRTLREMAGYLLREHPADSARWTQAGPAPVSSVSPAAPAQDGVRVRPARNPPAEPIAIIGMSGQFPGARDLPELWENLRAGKVCVTEIPPDRWPLDGFFEPDRARAAIEGRSYSKWGGFLEGFADFDAGFFQLSPREALMIDPQERLFLQEAWRAFEDAGYVPSKLTERELFGVYCGVTKGSFALRNDPASGLSCHTSFASLVNRVSYTFDLRGPSMPVDAMCASAAVAIHLACEALRRGEVRMALAGAVNLYLHPRSFLGLAQNKLLSASPTPRVFSSQGDGFVPSEGAGAVILKRLADAERDGDSIHAVIRASAVNHGGKTHAYAVPNPNQQAAVIRQALESASLSPGDLAYVECAANGSEAGDAIELRALQQVFGTCRIGSVKALLGHGESVSGLAQLFKVVLQLKHRTLCPTPMAGPDEALPFEIQTRAAEWPAGAGPRRAGINSFGAGGVNAHLIVEEYPAPRQAAVSPETPVLFLLSARSESALERYRERWRAYADSIPDAEFDLPAIAWRLQSAREAMKHRFACVVASRSALIAALTNAEPASAWRGVASAGKAAEAPVMERTLEQLAEHWVSGGAVEWAQLCVRQPGPPARPLPTYPFEQKRHWFAPEQACKVQCAGVSEPLAAGVRFVPLEALEEMAATGTALPMPPRESVEEVRGVLQTVLRELLFHDPSEELDAEASFEELGLSSVFVPPFVQRLAQELGLELRETLVFDYSTINRFSEYLAGRLGARPVTAA